MSTEGAAILLIVLFAIAAQTGQSGQASNPNLCTAYSDCASGGGQR